ncbi:hypothetical protein PR202_gb12560 [Eleusine coracana subsp. coracana]|uniref:F-box domain-containing protein n=1 Tax=Eleusine coracana subsp. coracana TaxID=191504 RepID=A0AAV5ERE0_ELECO|nr:hypothetical protein PR202_gb12560 [Eleusine coracana subsp. coracana]
MAPPPTLPDEIVEEILLRVPPDDPGRLMRASIACKGWRRLVSGPGFRRRFRQRHRSPPLMGLILNCIDENGVDMVSFVPTCSFRPPHFDLRRWGAIDSRHGRVLLLDVSPWKSQSGEVFSVWDPVAGEHRRLPPRPTSGYLDSFNAAVLCAAHGSCDHLDCHRGPFLVVFVGSYGESMFSYVYSSEADAWSASTSASHYPYFPEFTRSTVVVGNALYFDLKAPVRILTPVGILKYDLGTQEMTVIQPPPVWNGLIVLTIAEGGGLGCVSVMGSKLFLWSREAGPDGDMGWVQSRIIESEKLFPGDHAVMKLDVVAFEDGGGVVYVGTDRGSFATDLKSGQFRKIEGVSGFNDIVPFMSFYTPDRRRPEAGNSFTTEVVFPTSCISVVPSGGNRKERPWAADLAGDERARASQGPRIHHVRVPSHSPEYNHIALFLGVTDASAAPLHDIRLVYSPNDHLLEQVFMLTGRWFHQMKGLEVLND